MGRVRWSSPKASTCAPGSPRASFVGICSVPEAVGLLVRRRICQNPRTMKQSAICLVLAFVFLGCNQEAGPAPKTAPAADNAAYATDYPGELTTATARHEAEAKGSATLVEQIPKYPAELKDPDWTVAQTVYEKADRDGKSGHYAEVQ